MTHKQLSEPEAQDAVIVIVETLLEVFEQELDLVDVILTFVLQNILDFGAVHAFSRIHVVVDRLEVCIVALDLEIDFAQLSSLGYQSCLILIWK